MGHQVIDPARGPQCFCGAKGCWESLASGPAFGAWYTEQARERGLTVPPADAREVCLRAEQGDSLAQEAVLREGYYLGQGLANLVTLFVPDVIVLGGGVMQSWPMFAGQVRAIIRQNCGLVPHERTDLRLASLGTKTGLAGAARVWFHRYAA
jgi:glucokinase